MVGDHSTDHPEMKEFELGNGVLGGTDDPTGIGGSSGSNSLGGGIHGRNNDSSNIHGNGWWWYGGATSLNLPPGSLPPPPPSPHVSLNNSHRRLPLYQCRSCFPDQLLPGRAIPVRLQLV